MHFGTNPTSAIQTKIALGLYFVADLHLTTQIPFEEFYEEIVFGAFAFVGDGSYGHADRVVGTFFGAV